MKKSSANTPGEEYIANLPSLFKPMCSLPVLNNFLESLNDKYLGI